MLYAEDNKLVFRYDDHTLWLEPWGENALRVRATKLSQMPTEDWALSEKTVDTSGKVSISTPKDGTATITNGKTKAEVSRRGKIIIYDSSGKKLLEEYARHRLVGQTDGVEGSPRQHYEPCGTLRPSTLRLRPETLANPSTHHFRTLWIPNEVHSRSRPASSKA